MLLINSESKEAVVNRTDYEIVSMDNLGLNNKTDSYEYKIQKLNHQILTFYSMRCLQSRGLRNTFQSVMLLLCLRN